MITTPTSCTSIEVRTTLPPRLAFFRESWSGVPQTHTGPTPSSAPPLLHNSGTSTSQAIRHFGTHTCDLVRVSISCFLNLEFTATRRWESGGEIVGWTTAGRRKAGNVVHAWCHVLGLPYASDTQAIEQLREIVREAPLALAELPPIVAVVAATGSVVRSSLSDDPLMSLAVLCRCSNKVFIRGKSPMVTFANLERDIGLVLPLTTLESPR